MCIRDRNITDMTDMRLLHSIVFIEDPLITDSLNSIWRKYLSSSHLPTKSALKISRTNYKGEIDSQTTLDSKWCIPSNMVFTFYMGYACEIEMMGYLHYSIWNIMPTMPVSYTHLDVYKRQIILGAFFVGCNLHNLFD